MRLIRLLVLIALILALCIAAAPVVADGPQNAVTTQLALQEVAKTKTEGWLTIRVILTASDGSALGNRTVHFSQQVDFFGTRTIDLGTATTDAAGVATLAFQPAQTGTHVVMAEFAGVEEYAAAETSFDVEVTEVAPAFVTEEQVPLASVRRWLSISVGGLVVAVWAVLVGVVVIAVRGIRRAGQSPDATHEGVQQLAPPASEL